MLGYPSTSNLVSGVTEGSTTLRTITHDGAGNITADDRGGTVYNYRYNNRGRLDRLTIGSTVTADYTYDGLERMAIRATQNMTPAGTTHYVYDRAGRLIAESSGAGAALREYIWIDDLPLAVVADIDTITPKLWYVHADHLNRPARMTDDTKAVVWNAYYWPFGEVRSITGSASLNLRFPGQYFLVESGLHYNWHRHYDPTTGRYVQADPMEFVDGPSVYGYARSSPAMYVDRDGQFVPILIGIAAGLALEAVADYVEQNCSCGSGSSVGGYAAAAGVGGVLGDVQGYPRTGLGGGSSSGGTSRLSSGLSGVLGQSSRSLWAPTFRNPFSFTRNIGRFAGRWTGVGALVYAGYDIYRIGRCALK